MCYEITSENLLANYFASTTKESVSLSDLKDLRKKIEKKLKNQVYVDLTYESLIEAEEKNPSLFLWKEDHVLRGPKATLKYYFQNIDTFNWSIPQRIIKQYKSLVENHVPS